MCLKLLYRLVQHFRTGVRLFFGCFVILSTALVPFSLDQVLPSTKEGRSPDAGDQRRALIAPSHGLYLGRRDPWSTDSFDMSKPKSVLCKLS